MYFITHGVVRLSRDEAGITRDMTTLMMGEFFGEAALLRHQPNSNTATAVSPCSFYKLHRDDLEVTLAAQPTIRQALE